MNSIAAANLFENPLALLALILFGAFSSWLMKRRSQDGKDASPNEGELPPAPGEQGRSPKQLDWQDILRHLLGGEPPPPAPASPPRIPRADRDEQISPVGRGEEQIQREGRWLDELQEPDEELRQTGNRVGERSQQHRALAPANATRVVADERQEKADRNRVTFDGQAKHSVRAMSSAYSRSSSGRTRFAPPWREPRAVRRAFIASLVFAPPKGLET